MMFANINSWFPDSLFANMFAVLFFGVYIIDTITPMLFNKGVSPVPKLRRDRGSYLLIAVIGALAVFAGIGLRYWEVGVATGALQYVGLVLALAGFILREWAVIRLGRYFSRTVEIEAGHRLVTDGPYRWFRHPAYTGMLLVDTGLVLALGTWLGALIALALVLAATLYRIRVEERVLIDAFGDKYRDFMCRTWRLIPGW
jgi:isoprenylcysteine carboxyl methyltransferase (ICMT) family protein YpbQ